MLNKQADTAHCLWILMLHMILSSGSRRQSWLFCLVGDGRGKVTAVIFGISFHHFCFVFWRVLREKDGTMDCLNREKSVETIQHIARLLPKDKSELDRDGKCGLKISRFVDNAQPCCRVSVFWMSQCECATFTTVGFFTIHVLFARRYQTLFSFCLLNKGCFTSATWKGMTKKCKKPLDHF